jgi:AbrB family looped-hinge helix DNA binding protein
MDTRREREVTVGRQGRVVIPASLRKEMGLETGQVLMGSVEDGRLVLEPRDLILARLRARVRESIPEDVSLVDELLAERREQVRRDSDEV